VLHGLIQFETTWDRDEEEASSPTSDESNCSCSGLPLEEVLSTSIRPSPWFLKNLQ